MAAITLFDHAIHVTTSAADSHACIIDRTHGSDLVIPRPRPTLSCQAKVIFQNKLDNVDPNAQFPTVVRGGCIHWPCVQKWTLEMLAESAGDAAISVLPDESDVFETTSLRNFLRRFQEDSSHPSPSRPPYLRGWRFEEYAAYALCFCLISRLVLAEIKRASIC
jgi:hypothetical protein